MVNKIKNMEEKKLIIVLAGSVTTQSGYGSHSRDIAKALIKSGKYDVRIIPIRWGNTPQDALSPDRPEDKLILDRIVGPNLNYKPDIFIHVTIPNEFQKVGKYNIGITAGIETTLCQPEWLEGCNRMDLVLATSEHSKLVFEKSIFEKKDKRTNKRVNLIGLTRPVEVLFEGVDTDVYNSGCDKKSEIVKTLNEIPEDFCYLFVGHWLDGAMGHDRKDVGMMVRTFLETFKRKTKRKMPALILKTSQAGFSIMERETIVKKLNEIRRMVKGNVWKKDLPNIYVLYGNLTDVEMNCLYNHRKVKAMVSFTKGEGFGRPLLEFTTTGKPVIASGWSGHMDFLHKDYSILLPGKLENVHESSTNKWIMKDSKWFTVDYGVGSQSMLDVNKRYDLYLEKSKQQKTHTLDNFTFDKMVDKLCEYIDNIDDYAKIPSQLNQQVSDQFSPQQTKLNLPKLKMAGKSGDKPKAKRIELPAIKKV